MKFKEQLLSLLRVRSTAAGLEVSDEVLRLAVFDGKGWKMYAERLEPGILEQGKIKDRAAFIVAAAALRKQMGPKHAKKQVGVVLCLSSVDIYTQVFRLPMVKGGGLDEAVKLNLQMASPIPVNDAYSGWQVVGSNENTGQIEILAAFVMRKLVDEMADALFEGGFLAMAVESRGLALTRLVREKGAGVDVPKAYLFVNIDNFGLDFLVIRNGALYFEYQNPWHDLADEKGEITVEKFETTLAASLRQVLNFYGQSWPEALGAIILSTVAFQAEAERVITESATFPAMRLTLVMGQPISSEWLVVLGSSLRGSAARSKDPEINLLGADSRDRFHEERLLHFMAFWRTTIPVALIILLATFIAGDFFLGNAIAQAGFGESSPVDPAQMAQISTLESQAQAFNSKVTLLASVEETLQPKNALIEKLSSVADATGVTITQISLQSLTTPVSITGYAGAQDHILAFQTDLGNDAAFSNINLPLTGVQTQGNTVTFSMTFSFSPPSQ
jgi:Tfp pilus assembly protein PilN